ncbi:MAG TPA: hypothetical protein VMF04_02115 [Thermoplasmata archaeon]|nr:hypothetical protein [Thermoplasmata archaeon]
MSEYADAPATKDHHARSPISVLWVVAAALLCGAGLTLLWWWVTTFQWLFFSGVLFVLAGTVMFMNERAGWDHA